MKDRPAWKILSCYWDVWISLLMPCNSFHIPHKYFSKFSSSWSFWRIWVVLAVPVNRVLLAYVRVLNDWTKTSYWRPLSCPNSTIVLIIYSFLWGFLVCFFWGGIGVLFWCFVLGFCGGGGFLWGCFFFVEVVLGTVKENRCIVPFCHCTASYSLLRVWWVRSNKTGLLS